jgi:hypothetical protein
MSDFIDFVTSPYSEYRLIQSIGDLELVCFEVRVTALKSGRFIIT